MNDIVKKDILAVLDKAIGTLDLQEEEDMTNLKKLSNEVIHCASIFQDQYSISIAILIYALSKIIERKHNKTDYGIIIDLLKKAKAKLEANDIDGYNKIIQKIFLVITKIDNRVGMYVNEVITHAQIKKGTKLYEHGISMAQTAQILGVSQWDLMSYVGKTNISDNDFKIESLDKRMKYARGLFR